MTMKIEVPNPVHCVVCIHLGNHQQRAETIVHGNSVCVAHSLLVDEYPTLRAAISAAKHPARV